MIQVTDNGANDSRPAWSPDGTRLAYTNDITGNLDIWAIDVVTRATTQITTHPTNDDEADWTGSVIVFHSERDADGDMEIFKVSDDLSSAPVQLTFTTVEDRDPQWKPNGAQILFSRDAGDSEIYIMSANGSGQTNLTNNSAEDTDARISPDLTKIAFISNRTFSGDLWIMRPDGSQPIEVDGLSVAGAYRNPRWHP